ncbi:MAG: hypothetical protein Q7V17_05650 [Afipia sp.]|nr:hypothetical protein [Afipia sp.]
MSGFNPKEGVPVGKRYSEIYLDHGKPIQDHPRMRFRLAALISDTKPFWIDEALGQEAEKKLGLKTPYSSSSSWKVILEKWELQDVLDLVTVAGHFIQRDGRGPGASKLWATLVNQIFSDLNIAYRVDDQSGVHPYPDEEYSRAKAASIAALQAPRYANALNEFENGSKTISVDNKNAIRRTFASAEGLFRLMFPRSPRLTASESEQIAPLIEKLYANDTIAIGAAKKALLSFKDWIDACHFYRHEAGKQEVSQPPLSLTINLVSTGASFIRLLAELDAVEQA